MSTTGRQAERKRRRGYKEARSQAGRATIPAALQVRFQLKRFAKGVRMKPRPVKFFLRSVKFALFALATFVAAPAALAAGASKPEAMPDIVAQLRAAARFPEPLIRTTPTTRSEDDALLQALAAFERRAEPDDFASLTGFLEAHPDSSWRVALLTNLGLSYLHYGYYSNALDTLAAAWREGKAVGGVQSTALVDRAVGELALLHARLGHMEDVAALLEDIGDRPVTGPSTTTVQLAREALWVMKNDPKHMWICGVLALKFLMLADKASPEQVDFLQKYRADSPQGVSLAQLERLAEQAGTPYVAVFRNAGQPVPVPSVMHWKAGHYAAILSEENGVYRVYDPVLGLGDRSITAGAIKAEASGYYLVRADKAEGGQWRKVASEEAGEVWGAGPTNGPPPDFSGGSPAGPPPDCGGMTSYNISELAVGVILTDSPCGYVPPKGPSAKVAITYSQWEASQPAVFSFFNISPKWTFNWATYIQDDPHSVGSNVIRYRPTGGDSPESGYKSGTLAPDELDASVLVLASQNPVVYRRQLRDGTVETYAQSDGAASYPRHVFLNSITDPQGNTLTLNYRVVSNQVLLTSLTDATGRQTTFSYGVAGSPLLITRITDPFGRSANLDYDAEGRLISITDVLGLKSSFTYGANSLVNSLTTPYGTTTFAYGGSGNTRFVQVTDPLGYNEREETLQPAPVPFSDPANTVPQGIVSPFNQYLNYRDSFHWDKHAYVVAACKATGGCNYGLARITHFTHDVNNINMTWESIENRKYPLENRIWNNLPGQNSNSNCSIGTACAGTYDQPSAVGRVLDDGSTQLSQYAYNGAGNLAGFVDPAGRTTNFTYAPNMIDLVEVDQVIGQSSVPVAQYTYNQQHRPLTYTDAALQVTQYSYNGAGQLTQIALPLGRVWKMSYDALGRLTSVVNPNGVAQVSYTYDAFDRVATATDSEGYTQRYAYDAADRVTQIAYLDGTTRTYAYKSLDLVSATDRQGRTTQWRYDANRNLVSISNPLDVGYAYFENGALKSVTDSNGNTTSWTVDVQSRVTQKQYADGTQLNFAYEATTSRLKSITDALGQVKQFGSITGRRRSSTPKW
jgi:YD repeat-containing protein